MTPTAEQEAIIEAGRYSADNLLISALAGAAKTSTLVMLSQAVKVQTLCLAFNKKIAVEMQERLPLHCTSKTLNSLGHSAWGRTIGRKLQLDTRKTYTILSSLIEESPPKVKDLAYDQMAEIMRMIDGGKTAGWVPDRFETPSKRLLDDAAFFDSLDDEVDPTLEHLIVDASFLSLHQAFQGKIDFNDQILCPTVFPSPFDPTPLVMIDEAQDLSELNHAMLRKVAKKRLIAVGDPCQSIYGFRGAHESSMELLREQFSMRELHLTTSFRCPIAIVKEAQWRAPAMKWPEWAQKGRVSELHEWHVSALPEDAVILCRNNAPLFSLAIALLRRGRYPELVGNDIGKMLVKMLRKMGKEGMKRDAVLAAIAEWEDAKLLKSRNPSRIHDQAACLRVFAEQAETLGGAIAYAEKIMATSGPVKLMTIHKAKGLEFPNVFILDKHLIHDDQQDQNLLYVAQTRAKASLTYITSKGLTDAEA